MNVYLEIFGYIGTLTVIISMTMKSVTRLRVINMLGSIICMIYALLSTAYPIVCMNAALIVINLIRLIKDGRAEKNNLKGEDK